MNRRKERGLKSNTNVRVLIRDSQVRRRKLRRGAVQRKNITPLLELESALQAMEMIGRSSSTQTANRTLGNFGPAKSDRHLANYDEQLWLARFKILKGNRSTIQPQQEKQI